MRMIAWDAAYAAYLRSGLSKTAFHRTRLIEFSENGKLPSLHYFYKKLLELEKTIIQDAQFKPIVDGAPSQEEPIPVQPAGRNIFVAREIPRSAQSAGSQGVQGVPGVHLRLARRVQVVQDEHPQPLQAAPMGQQLPPPQRPQISTRLRSTDPDPRGTLVFIKLPNGIELRFRTDSPETLAMQMISVGGFAE